EMERSPSLSAWSCVYTSYFATVAAAGSEADVMRDTTIMRTAEPIVIGTTGRKPSTVVPAAPRVMTSTPPTAQIGTPAPGRGAGTTACRIAIASTAAAVHSVTASAPHRVLFFQKSAAASSGESAAYPAKAYWLAMSKIDCGAVSAIAYATNVRRTTNRR